MQLPHRPKLDEVAHDCGLHPVKCDLFIPLKHFLQCLLQVASGAKLDVHLVMPLPAPDVVFNRSDVLVPPPLLLISTLTCHIAIAPDIHKSPFKVSKLFFLLRNYIMDLSHVVGLIVSLVPEKLKIVDQQINVHLSHLKSLVQPVTRLHRDFLFATEQFDLFDDPLSVHFGSLDFFLQPMVDLLFFAKLFFHLGRYDRFDVIPAAGCLL